MNAIDTKNKKGIRWSKETMMKAKLLLSVGSTGYSLLQDVSIPLPDVTTKERTVQHIKLVPGVLGEEFNVLRPKVTNLKMKIECVLTVEKIGIIPSVELHLGIGKLIGDVTLPRHAGAAIYVCVFMSAESTTRWHQGVAYHFSGTTTNGANYNLLILKTFLW